jgi:hypothetical protein
MMKRSPFMCPDPGLPPEEDIQQALQQAHNPSAPEAFNPTLAAGEVLTESQSCPILGLRYALAKCGIMAEKYPWQTTVVLLVTAGCAWICAYFGATLLVALVLLAVYGDD